MANSGNREFNKTIDHLFRTEAGKMVSVLTRLFGFSNIEQAEDIVQDTILKALQTWRYGRIPVNPQAWLYKTAKNNAIDIIRRNKLKYKIENEISVLLKSEFTSLSGTPKISLAVIACTSRSSSKALHKFVS